MRTFFFSGSAFFCFFQISGEFQSKTFFRLIFLRNFRDLRFCESRVSSGIFLISLKARFCRGEKKNRGAFEPHHSSTE